MSNTQSLDHLLPDMQDRAKRLADGINNQLPRLIGDMLVDAFRKSWRQQSFNDTGAPPWKEVKRRTPGSPWYGFNMKSNSKVPSGSRGLTKGGKDKQFGTKGGKTNFTATATTRYILLGWGSSGLRDSIFVSRAANGTVAVASNKPHAKVHNEGGTIRVFGKKTVTVPKRQFMGHSSIAEKQARRMIGKYITNIMQK